MVLDDADKMISQPEMYATLQEILEQSDLPPKWERQTLLFSATFPDPVQVIAKKDLLNRNFCFVYVENAAENARRVRLP